MTLTNITAIKNQLTVHRLRPDHSLGQNFLIDERFLQKIVEAAELRNDDTVVEIGAGLGTLTVELAKRAGRVITFEIDRKLLPILRKNLQGMNNVEILEQDFLSVDLFEVLVGMSSSLRATHQSQLDQAGAVQLGAGQAPRSNLVGLPAGKAGIAAPPSGARNDKKKPQGNFTVSYKVAANLPYQITSAAIEKILETRQNFAGQNLGGQGSLELMVLLVQKEVAERICARSGEMSLLSVAVQYYGVPEIIARVPAGAFWPVPKVDSAVLKVVMRPAPLLEDKRAFFKIVKAGFSRRRAMLKNNLRPIIPEEGLLTIFKELNIDPKIRAEELTLADWHKLTQSINEKPAL